jgi:predicted dinucleotide-binding enzyme
MRYGILGTGTVGQTLATKLVAVGHEVCMGARDAANEKAAAWAAAEGGRHGTFADAAEFGEVVVNATAGTASLEALGLAGAERLAGKVLIDVANPLDFSGGMPPRLSVCNDDSLGEQIQREFPDARVVKALNTMGAPVMVDPSSVPGEHTVFVCGADDGAKQEVRRMLESFGWPEGSMLDLGGIDGARGMEMYLPLWLKMFGAAGTPVLNVAVLVADG